jgi:flagellar transcriptional activator FlhD
MNTRQTLNEIRETNLNFMILAQKLIAADREMALEQLGISEDCAQMMEQLTPAQMLKAANGSTLLCRFDQDDEWVWGLITQHSVAGRLAGAVSQAQAAASPSLRAAA